MSLRRALKKIHLWLGLTFGFFWALQGLTGASLVFHYELARVGIPRPTGGPAASIDDILSSIEPQTKGGRVTRLSLADAHADLIEVSYIDSSKHPRVLLIDAATTGVLDEQDLAPATPFTGSASRWLLNLHTSLLSGRIGETFIGISGCVLLTTALVGLYLAWPPRNGWRTVYSWHRWRTTLQRLHGWHRALGLTAAFFILFVALSGVWMTFADDLRPALARVVPHQLPYRAKSTGPSNTVVSAQQAINIAQAQLPQARWVRVSLPTAKSLVYTIRFHRPEEAAWLGRTAVAVDAATGRVASVYDSTVAPLSNRIDDTLLPLHDGERFGVLSQIIMMLAGLSLPTLYVTALWRWLAATTRIAEEHN